ncbi:hypothetical protein AUTU_15670 [Aureibacter tunicatorum]|nr:hypothetical protein AUTU_15670 [Aureibacter tunicatorum]
MIKTNQYLGLGTALYIFYMVGLGALLLIYPKGQLELWLNDQHTQFGDLFFKYVTYLGDGALFAVLGIATLFVRYSYFVLLAKIIVLQTLIVQVMKRFVFDLPRPKLFFENYDVALNFVEGVKVHGHHSFPSGHTASAFVIFIFLSLILKNRYFTIFGLLVAGLVGISRVYLLQHFFVDIFFGSIIGVFSVAVVWRLYEVNRMPWLNSPFMMKKLVLA